MPDYQSFVFRSSFKNGIRASIFTGNAPSSCYVTSPDGLGGMRTNRRTLSQIMDVLEI